MWVKYCLNKLEFYKFGGFDVDVEDRPLSTRSYSLAGESIGNAAAGILPE